MLVVMLLVITASIFLYQRGFFFFDVVELKSLDWHFRFRGIKTPDPRIVLIVVDQKSLDSIGRWPWPRVYHTLLLKKLARADVGQVVFDMVFSLPDESRFSYLLDEVLSYAHKEQWFTPQLAETIDLIKEQSNYDQSFAQIILDMQRVHLGYFFFTDNEEITHIGRHIIAAEEKSILSQQYPFIKGPSAQKKFPALVHAAAVESNIEQLSDNAFSTGFFNVIHDIDGTVRWVPLIIKFQDHLYPSLSIQVLRLLCNIDMYHTSVQYDEYGIADLQIGDRHIPVDSGGKIVINYRGPEYTYPRYSFCDVLDGRIPLKNFTNKIILVGAVSTTLHDISKTPFSSRGCPGTEIRANIIDTLINEDYITEVPGGRLSTVCLIVLFSLIIGASVIFLSPLISFLMAFILFIGFLAAAQWCFNQYNWWVEVVYPSFSLFMIYIGCSAAKHFLEERKTGLIKKAFQYFVNPQVVEELILHPEQIALGGEKKQLTVLFADIRNFSSLSENETPESLVRFLNRYFSLMTDLVMAAEGTLDKYIGDGLMAFWGAPLAQNSHAAMACHTALMMLREIQRHNIPQSVDPLHSFQIGIGINTGPMVVGNMGSHTRFQYTVAGDHVNITFRIEALNKVYGTAILISEFTYEYVHTEYICRQIDWVRVKGRKRVIKIYELIAAHHDTTSETIEFVNLFHEGLDWYKEQKWEQALSIFQRLNSLRPADKAVIIYIERCQDVINDKVLIPSVWDGVWPGE